MAQEGLKGKKFLYCIFNIQLQINEISEELDYWQQQTEFCGQNLELLRDIHHRTAELHSLITTMNERKMSATKLIDAVSDPVGRAILRRRYILCNSWSDIAEACGKMTERNAHYIHDRALMDFEKIYCGCETVFI